MSRICVPCATLCLSGLLLVLSGATLPAQDSGSLDAAQKAASQLLVDRLRRERPEQYARLIRCPRSSVLLVDGRHDHTDRVLHALRIPFRRCAAETLHREPLHRVRFLIVDCPGRVTVDGAHRIRRFVERGGTLLTTDWAVLHVLEPAFPGLVRYTRRPTRDDVVRISRISPDPLLRRVFPPRRPACWWLENQSYPVEILDRRRVRVLLESHEMGRKYGSPILSFVFEWGRGRVVHIVSHTYLQRNDLRHPWELRSVAKEAAGLGLSTESKAYRRLKRSGVLDRLPAGHLNAALSAQQFLLNIFVSSLGPAPGPAPRPTPRPEENPGPVVISRPSGGTASSCARETHLFDQPRGQPVLLIARGLRLRIRERRSGWVRVETPAGQSGWIKAGDIAP